MQISALSCVSGAGQCMPWDRQSLKPELAEEEVPGTIYGLSKKVGWIKNFSKKSSVDIFSIMLLLHVRYWLC